MSTEDNKELNKILAAAVTSSKPTNPRRGRAYDDGWDEDDMAKSGLTQWSTSDGKVFFPTSHTKQELTPGVYEVRMYPSQGLYFQKVPTKGESLLKFPDSNSDKVISEIEKFWAREDLFVHYGLAYKRGIILWGPPGCHAAGTEILQYDGSVKSVEDVEVGDELMGPDSKPRRVLELSRGHEKMYEVIPKKGMPFVVNASHILSLKRSGEREKSWLPDLLNIKVKEFLEMSESTRSRFKLHRAGVEFETSVQEIDPYYLGLWLGDGTASSTDITTMDEEIVNYIYEFAESCELEVSKKSKSEDNKASTYSIVYNAGKACPKGAIKEGRNWLRTVLKTMNLYKNKHIPQNYLVASREQRLQLLAGLIDSDGHLSNSNVCKGYYEITQKDYQLTKDIVWIARSLGLAAYSKVKKVDGKEYYRTSIFGDIHHVPVKIERKKADVGNPNKNALLTGFKLKELPEDKYYGFSLSGDHLYLDGTFMVHHNTGKSCTIQLVCKDVIERGGVVIKFGVPDLFKEGIRYFREIQSETPCVVLMEDIDSTLEMYNESEVLNILDGVDECTKTVFLATTNYPADLGERIMNRPSRFDKRFKIGFPTAEARQLYFEYLIQNNEKDDESVPESVKDMKIDIKKWVKDTKGFSVSHLKELFIAVVILGDEYKDAVETLQTMMDVGSDVEKEETGGVGFHAEPGKDSKGW